MGLNSNLAVTHANKHVGGRKRKMKHKHLEFEVNQWYNDHYGIMETLSAKCSSCGLDIPEVV